jgi:hypothetical protein
MFLLPGEKWAICCFGFTVVMWVGWRLLIDVLLRHGWGWVGTGNFQNILDVTFQHLNNFQDALDATVQHLSQGSSNTVSMLRCNIFL